MNVPPGGGSGDASAFTLSIGCHTGLRRYAARARRRTLHLGTSSTRGSDRRIPAEPCTVRGSDVATRRAFRPGHPPGNEGVRTAMRYLYMAQTERETLQLRRPMFPRRREDETSDD